MSLTGMPNSVDAFKTIAKELKEKADEAGVGAVDEFLNELDDIKAKAQAGPGDALDRVKQGLEKFQASLKDALNDPGALAGSGGGMSACASWYGDSVAEKLRAISDEADDISESVSTQSKEITSSFDDLSGTLTKASDGLDSTAKQLTRLPDEVMAIAENVKEPKDLKEVDTGPMERACDVSGIEDPLNDIDGLKQKLSPIITGLKGCLQKLSRFITTAPDDIRDAFDIPSPLCCVQPCILSQGPPAMKNLLDKLELIKGIDLDPVVENVTKTEKTLLGVEVDGVKTTLNTFSSEAKEKVGLMSKAVAAVQAGDAAMETAKSIKSSLTSGNAKNIKSSVREGAKSLRSSMGAVGKLF